MERVRIWLILTHEGKAILKEFITIKARANLPDYLKLVLTMAYYSGWRKKEILNLT
jgi:predicted house-cleaning noncanonical NTP pyrophosphatase (MazG superfamily)